MQQHRRGPVGHPWREGGTENPAGKLRSTGPESFKTPTSCFLLGVAFATTHFVQHSSGRAFLRLTLCLPRAAGKYTWFIIYSTSSFLTNRPTFRRGEKTRTSIAKLSRRATLKEKGHPLHIWIQGLFGQLLHVVQQFAHDAQHSHRAAGPKHNNILRLPWLDCVCSAFSRILAVCCFAPLRSQQNVV